MTTNLDVDKLNFGSDDAEQDEQRGFLDKVFLKTAIYRRIKEFNRELIVGRKGSGKSAIFFMLKKALEHEGATVIPVTSDELSQQKIDQLKKSSLNKDEAFFLYWRYVLLVKVARELLSIGKQPRFQKQRKVLRSIRKFLVENGELDRNFLEKFSRKVGIFSKFSVTGWGAGVSWEARQQDAPKDLINELDKFQSKIVFMLTELRDKKIFVLIDKVDDKWNQTFESQLIIIGLIKAIHDLNSIFRQIHIFLFLRSDIYDMLKFNDADKFHSLEERLDWKEDDLKKLIATRGKVSADLDLDPSHIADLWNALFEEQVNGEESFNYILERTFKRPRELIQFCNNALTEAQNNNHDRIYANDILKAERQYSDWKRKDLSIEFLVQHPYLEELLGLFQGFKAEFMREEFDERYREAQKTLPQYADLQAISTDRMLQILFIIGFLGACQDKKSLFVFDDATLVLAQQKLIAIHPVFHLALGLQKTTKDSVAAEVAGSTTAKGNSLVPIDTGSSNVVGHISGGATVTPQYYDPQTTTTREIDSLRRELEDLITEREKLRKQIEAENLLNASPSTRLQMQLETIQENIAYTSQRMVTLNQYLSSKALPPLYELLQNCAVRIGVLGAPRGTGFFVAPGLILTCAHVVQDAQIRNVPAEVIWRGQTTPAQIRGFRNPPYPDLALLRVDAFNHPCVLLDRKVNALGELYSYGFSDIGPEGDSALFVAEGWAGNQQELLKLKLGQMLTGMSGSPLLNQETGAVCGIIQLTRDRSSDLSGRAIPTKTVFQEFPELEAQQRQFHQQDKRWAECLTQQQRHHIGWLPTTTFTGGIEAFLSYAPEDEALVDELTKNLQIMKRQGLITNWSKDDISAGREVKQEAKERLDTAHIILLFVSPDFLAFDYHYDVEMARALERHKTGTARVIPIILRHTEGWEQTEFGKLLTLPRNSKPITNWRNRDEALQEVAKGIRTAVEQLRQNL